VLWILLLHTRVLHLKRKFSERVEAL
jgi:hypothetical protein